MRKIKYLVAASLDGQIAREDGSFDCFPNDDVLAAEYAEWVRGFEAVLMGRRTYEVALKAGVTDPYPYLESFVFSRTMSHSPDPRVQLVRDDPAGFVRQLKDRPGGDIYLCGGGELASVLFAAGLVDELLIKLNPLLIGSGIPLFSRIASPCLLELIDWKRYASGIVLLHYRVTI